MTDLSLVILRIALQLTVVTGLLLMGRVFVDFISQRVSRRDELKARILKKASNLKQTSSLFQRHIEDKMLLVYNDFQPNVHYNRFLFTSIVYGLSLFIILYFSVDKLPGQFTNNPFEVEIENDSAGGSEWSVSFIFAFIGLFLPYMRLRYRYALAYARASYDLMEPTKFISKFAHLSVDKALAETAKILPDTNVLKQPLRQLGLTFISYRDEEELVSATKRFNNLIGTTFAAQFTSNLLYAEREGSQNMKKDFQSLYKAMEQQRETILEVKANSRDAVQMGIYLNLIIFVALTGSLIYLLRPAIYFRFQFETTLGITFFMAIVSTYLVTVIYSIVLTRPKLDY